MNQVLGIAEYSSFGHWLSNLQEIFKRTSVLAIPNTIEVLEMIPVCGGVAAIVAGPADQLSALFKELPREDEDRVLVLPRHDPAVLRALYSLDNSPVQKNLLVLEGEFAGDLLLQAQHAVEAQISIVDLKIPRGASRRGHLMLTHESEKNLTSYRSSVVDGLSRVTLIRDIADGFKKYFDLSPKA